MTTFVRHATFKLLNSAHLTLISVWKVHKNWVSVHQKLKSRISQSGDQNVNDFRALEDISTRFNWICGVTCVCMMLQQLFICISRLIRSTEFVAEMFFNHYLLCIFIFACSMLFRHNMSNRDHSPRGHSSSCTVNKFSSTFNCIFPFFCVFFGLRHC